MTSEELEYHEAGALVKLLNENTELELERDVFRSAWRAELLRRESMPIRRLRLIVEGAATGALIAWLIDGEIAGHLYRVWPIVDRALAWLGWS